MKLLRPVLRLRRNLLRRLAFALVACLLFLGLCEITARVGLRLHADAKYGPRLASFHEADLKADPVTGWSWGDAFLFRGRETVAVDKPAGLRRLVTIGDSCVYGAMVASESTFAAKLDTLLKTDLGVDRVEVLNAGVPGYNTQQATAHLREKIAPYRPDVVIYYGTGADAALWLRGTDPSRAPRLDRLHHRLFASRAFLVLDRLVRSFHQREKPTATTLVQNDDLTSLRRACDSLGARLLLVEYLVGEDGLITSDLDGIGYDFAVPVVRLLPTFREINRPTRELIYDHEHSTPLGHSLIADRLRSEITALGWLKDTT